MHKLLIPNDVLLPEVVRMVNERKSVILKTKGDSMLPFIIGGCDSVVLQKAEKICIGDIVLAKVSEKRFILHRIIEINGENVTLMGDGNLRGTEHCTMDEVLAKAVKIIHGNKSIDTDSPASRRKAAVWRKLLPVRRWLLAIYKRIMIKNNEKR